jgi:hypothetical protein
MQRRNGRWLIADVTPRSEGDADTTRWEKGWCDLGLDLGRDELVAVIGHRRASTTGWTPRIGAS